MEERRKDFLTREVVDNCEKLFRNYNVIKLRTLSGKIVYLNLDKYKKLEKLIGGLPVSL